MKKVKLIFAFLFSLITVLSNAQNPWEDLGYKLKNEPLTLSKGKYQEFFKNDTIVQIGSVLYNTITDEVVAFIETDTLYSEATLKPEIISRWLSPDPLADEFPSWTPYNYVENNPILKIDPDGRFPIESFWDAANVIWDLGKGIYHEIAGNRQEANQAWTDFGYDGAALAIPYVPAGLSKVRYVDDVAAKMNKAGDAKQVMTKADDLKNAPKQIGPAGDAGAQVTKQIPADWNMKTSNKGNGTKFLDPKNPGGNNVRVQGGNPKSPNSSQQNPYVKQTKDGKTVDVNGKQIKPDSKEAHIPKEDFKYK